jgi:hypothetical protein
MDYEAYMEEMDYEFNARYDYAHEAYAATALDPYHEGYCDYCDACADEGVEPKDFRDWRADQCRAVPAPPPVAYGAGDIPF